MTETGPEIHPDRPDNEQLLDALSRVLASQTFAEVFRLKKFLSYVVGETVAGRGERLKGFVIACEVFDKDDPSDAQTTTVVRVEAGRLRRRLKDYYETEGKNDPIQISIPKGAYSATFTPAGTPSPALLQSWKPGSGKHPLRYPTTWILVTVSLLLLFILFGDREENSKVVSETLPGVRPAIAVLPFKNMAVDKGARLFANELAEDIALDLGSLPALDVISISSVRAYSGLNLSPQELGAQLGVPYVLDGTVLEVSPNLRVTAGLYETVEGRQLWSESFDYQAGEQQALQKELAQKVVSSLSISVQGNEANVFGRHFTDNREAWFLYKQAMNLANPPSEPARVDLAQKAFEQLIEMDHDFAGGYAGSAYTRAFKVFFGHSEVPFADRQAALELAARARELDPSFGLTFSALAFIHMSRREFEEALQMSLRAIEIQPNDPYINVYHGFIVAAAGDLERGIEYARRAVRLDPLHARTPYLNILGLLNFLAGHYEEALNALQRNQERGGPLGAGQMRVLAAAYSKTGEPAKAEYTLKVANSLAPETGRWKDWLSNAFEDPAVLQTLFDEIESIN
jgi:TolB-like protein/Tfp pilus assembly protein PilF